jgi:hypothetical protein
MSIKVNEYVNLNPVKDAKTNEIVYYYVMYVGMNLGAVRPNGELKKNTPNAMYDTHLKPYLLEGMEYIKEGHTQAKEFLKHWTGYEY